jgi:hypothetical protein
MLFRDHFFGFTDWRGLPTVSADEVHWTMWDYALADAIQLIADYTDSHGHLIWEREGEQVEAVAVKKIDKAQAAIDRKTKGSKNKPYEPSPGETWQTRLILRPGWEEEGWPTLRDYIEAENARLGIDPENE